MSPVMRRITHLVRRAGGLGRALTRRSGPGRGGGEATAELLRAVLENVDAAIAYYDDQQRLVLANATARSGALASGFDLAGPSFEGSFIYDSQDGDPVPVQDQLIPSALRGHHRRHQLAWFGPPAERRAFVGSSTAVTKPDGSTMGTLVFGYDVTQLALALNAQKNLVAGVSHELRTPLTVIASYLELLGDSGSEDPMVGRAVEAMTRATRQLSLRVEQLLDAAERPEPTRGEVDVDELLASVRASFEPAHPDRVRIPDPARRPRQLQCWGDRAAMEQALENLVANALKFSPDPSPVVLDADGDQREVRISVSDRGPGMSEVEVRNAVRPFWRGERSKNLAIPGLGLGLSLVHDIVTAHDGRVDVCSELGQGTTITLVFPTEEPSASRA